jgi:hypothetical protein
MRLTWTFLPLVTIDLRGQKAIDVPDVIEQKVGTCERISR